MPNKGTKKSFDKKTSATFNLVYRSKKDPLTVDATAPQRVLVPVYNTKECKGDKKKYTVFFDNEYDYLKHLEDSTIFTNHCIKVGHLSNHLKNVSIKDKSNINLPSSVFESNIQEKAGFLNEISYNSGLRLDLDPDIVAALDDEFDFNNSDNQLEDNFIELANKEYDLNEYNIKCYGNTHLNNRTFTWNKKEVEVYNSLTSDQYMFQDEEVQSNFTEYSLSSNVIKRNEHLNLLDHKFEKIYRNYDENEIGDLDGDEIEGHIESNSNVIIQYAKEYEKQQKQNINNIKFMIDLIKVIDAEFYSSNKNKDKINYEKFIVKDQQKNKWDCESFLSTYNNIYNNPKLISEEKDQIKNKQDFKIDIPNTFLNKKYQMKLTAQNLVKFKTGLNKSVKLESFVMKNAIEPDMNSLNVRLINETSQERKNRKNFIKSQRKKRRHDRKINLKIFQEEKKRQEKIMINEMKRVQGNRIL